MNDVQEVSTSLQCWFSLIYCARFTLSEIRRYAVIVVLDHNTTNDIFACVVNKIISLKERLKPLLYVL